MSGITLSGMRGDVSDVRMKSRDQHADAMIKPLPQGVFNRHR